MVCCEMQCDRVFVHIFGILRRTLRILCQLLRFYPFLLFELYRLEHVLLLQEFRGMDSFGHHMFF